MGWPKISTFLAMKRQLRGSAGLPGHLPILLHVRSKLLSNTEWVNKGIYLIVSPDLCRSYRLE
jgi:hypothetical protein